MNFIEKIKNDTIIQLIKKHASNVQLYLVGGCIRDYILGKENFDKDIIADTKNPKEFALNLSKQLGATFIELDCENKIYRLVLKDKLNFIDIAGILGESIGDDLKRRDITINSIALNLHNYEILDVNNGLNDIKKGIIKHISEKNIKDDYLRIIRAFRFQSTLGFKLDDELKILLKKYCKQLKTCSKERINYELLKLFGGKNCENTLIEMDECNLIEDVFPIFKDVKKVPANTHHHLPLFMHLIETVKQIQELYENSEKEIKTHLEKTDFGGATRLAHLKLAGFLHDIGKPQTWTIEQDTGRHRFIKHDDLGAKMSIEILKKEKYSKKQINYISTMIKFHIYPSHVISAPELNEKVFMRFIRKMEENSIDVIILAMADRLSARGEAVSETMIHTNLNNLEKLMKFYLNIKDSLKPLEKLLDGEEIMELKNIKPSKQLGTIISKLHEAQISGDINTKEEAIIFVKNLNISKI